MHPDTQKYREKIKTYRGLILFALFVYFALQNLSLIWDIAMRLLSILTPFLIGGGIAFVLNILVSRIEDLLRFTPIRPRLMRIISVISSLLIFAGHRLLPVRDHPAPLYIGREHHRAAAARSGGLRRLDQSDGGKIPAAAHAGGKREHREPQQPEL